MPTDTFFRLPDEKRARLTEAIRRELARVPFSEYSINRVVREAGIPRGSYYQYFLDRDDVYTYIAKTYRDAVEQSFRLHLASNGGDLFLAIPPLFDEAVDYVRSQEDKQLLYNIIAEMKSREVLPHPPHGCYGHEKPALPDELNASLLAADNGGDCREMMILAFSLFGAAILEVFHGTGAADAREHLIKRLRWMESGMRRKNA